MNFFLDIHCHTNACNHASATIDGIAFQALKNNFTLAGISDHAPEMIGGASVHYFSAIASQPHHVNDLRFLKGAEVNILDKDGELDLPSQVLKLLDFSIASLHGGIFLFNDIKSCTEAVVNVMNHPYVSILGHPGDPHFPLDPLQVVTAAKETYTIIEINNHSLEPSSWRYGGEETLKEMLLLCHTLRVPVLASSDAHVNENVGKLDLAKALIESSGIDEKLVLNTDAERLLNALALKREKFNRKKS